MFSSTQTFSLPDLGKCSVATRLEDTGESRIDITTEGSSAPKFLEIPKGLLADVYRNIARLHSMELARTGQRPVPGSPEYDASHTEGYDDSDEDETDF